MKTPILSMLIITLVIAGCATPGTMLIKDKSVAEFKNIKPQPGKSALVVARTHYFHHLASWIDTYVDKRMIGAGTIDNGYFSLTDITPGEHYLLTSSYNPYMNISNIDVVKIIFEQGKVYYLHQVPSFGSVVLHVNKPEFIMETWDDNCKRLEYDAANPGSDFAEKKYIKAIREYEEEIRKGKYKDHANIIGFEVTK